MSNKEPRFKRVANKEFSQLVLQRKSHLKNYAYMINLTNKAVIWEVPVLKLFCETRTVL